jgi:hypothetical protein
MVVSQSDTEVLGAQAALRYQSNALDTFIGIGLQYAYRFRQPATQTEANDMTELNANKAAGVAGYATGLGKPPSLHTSLRKDQSGNPAGRSPKVPCASVRR